MEKNSIRFEVCGLPFKIFIPSFVTVMVTVYFGFITATRLADELTASSLVATIAYLMMDRKILLYATTRYIPRYSLSHPSLSSLQ